MNGVSMTCFAGGYLIALLLESARMLIPARTPRVAWALGAAVLGLAAHSIYLVNLAREQWGLGGGLLTGWYEWCLLGAWLLAAIYISLAAQRPENNLGVFLLPMVMFLIVASLVSRQFAPEPFTQSEAIGAWRVIHGTAQLVGAAAVLLGFSSGVMYLVQARRLKQGRVARPGSRLPSLEWLRRVNHNMLFVSLVSCTVGLISGVILNANRQGAVAWSSPVVWSSGVLVAWLGAAVLFERVYRPARQGHKVAYLTTASALFLVLALGLVLMNRHGAGEGQPSAPPTAESPR